MNEPSSSSMQIDIPEPKYRIGMIVIALINHQPRYAEIQQSYLSPHVVMTEEGVHIEGNPVWEYHVYVLHEDSIETIIISERTIISAVDLLG